jgi:hypothetical protein
MTRYSLEEYDWSAESSDSQNEKKILTVFVQLMSGDLLSVQHPSWKSLYALKQSLHEYCPLWKPHLIHFYQKDSKEEWVECLSVSQDVKEGDIFYLFVDDKKAE